LRVLQQLQHWYARHCDDDWEQFHGVELTTLDNPGWRLTVSLVGTVLEGRSFALKVKRSKSDWVDCSVEENKFVGAGGSFNLTELMEIFLCWDKAVRKELKQL